MGKMETLWTVGARLRGIGSRFPTAYNMLWKKKLFLQPHILKRKLIHHIFVKKKGTQQKHMANVLLKEMKKNWKIMTMMIQESPKKSQG